MALIHSIELAATARLAVTMIIVTTASQENAGWGGGGDGLVILPIRSPSACMRIVSHGRGPWCAWADANSVRILPNSGSIPIGRNGTFACASNDTFLYWLVTLPGPGQSPLQIPNAVTGIVNLLKRYGVFYDAAVVPSLRINGSWENNGTEIACVAIRGPIASSDNLIINVYGKPP